MIELVIEKLDDGEVSPFFHDVVQPGDTIEMRGPIGGHFNWGAEDGGPILLVGGGSGVVPLMSMVRAAQRATPIRLLYSSRTWDDVIYREELERRTWDGVEVSYALTRSQPEGWRGYSRRIDDEILREVAWPAEDGPHVFVCGSTRFVDAAADGLLRLGYEAGWVRTERFGATGG
jgi:ferredoxin-NADP reductase